MHEQYREVIEQDKQYEQNKENFKGFKRRDNNDSYCPSFSIMGE